MTAAATLAALATPASAATVLDVSPGEGCGKTTCFNEKGVFTRAWSAKDFSGPVSVGQLLMDRGVLGSLDGATFRLSFQLNGEELGSWGQYTMAGIGGDELTFGGQNFTWNPEDGDLVLVLAIVPPPEPGGGGGGGGSFGAPGLDSPQAGDFGRGAESNSVIVEALIPVPEPSTWALMIGGFGLAGAALRRRGAVLRTQP